jgi:hypothetical protein
MCSLCIVNVTRLNYIPLFCKIETRFVRFIYLYINFLTEKTTKLNLCNFQFYFSSLKRIVYIVQKLSIVYSYASMISNFWKKKNTLCEVKILEMYIVLVPYVLLDHNMRNASSTVSRFTSCRSSSVFHRTMTSVIET